LRRARAQLPHGVAHGFEFHAVEGGEVVSFFKRKSMSPLYMRLLIAGSM